MPVTQPREGNTPWAGVLYRTFWTVRNGCPSIPDDSTRVCSSMTEQKVRMKICEKKPAVSGGERQIVKSSTGGTHLEGVQKVAGRGKASELRE